MPSNQPAQPEPPKTELEEIQIQTNRVQNEVSKYKCFFSLTLLFMLLKMR